MNKKQKTEPFPRHGKILPRGNYCESNRCKTVIEKRGKFDLSG